MLYKLFLVVPAIFYQLYYEIKRRFSGRLPPGPRGLPLVGNLIDWPEGEPCRVKLSRWAEEFGNLFTLNFPTKTVVVVNDDNVMMDICNTLQATKLNVLRQMLSGSDDTHFDTADSLSQARFSVRSLREFGFGREAYALPIVSVEAERLCRWIEQHINDHGGERLLLHEPILNSISNVVWMIITGEIISNEEELRKPRIAYLNKKWRGAYMNAFRNLLFFFPWLKHVAPVRSGYQRLKDTGLELEAYMEVFFREHSQTKTNGEPPRDLIDAYIDKIEESRDTDSAFGGDLGRKHSYYSILRLMLTSAICITNGFNWLVFYLSAHADVQRKLQEEIDRVIGKNGNPEIAHKESMPYLEAVILETLRLSSICPHRSYALLIEDVSYHNYIFPRGTMLLPNVYDVNNDRNVWGDPEKFRPDRFIEDGNEHLKAKVKAFRTENSFFPFGRFAKDVLFLYATKLLQTYTFSVDANAENVERCLRPVSEIKHTPTKVVYNVTPRF